MVFNKNSTEHLQMLRQVYCTNTGVQLGDMEFITVPYHLVCAFVVASEGRRE